MCVKRSRIPKNLSNGRLNLLDKRSEREFLIKEDSDSPNAHLITHIENDKATEEEGPIVE